MLQNGGVRLPARQPRPLFSWSASPPGLIEINKAYPEGYLSVEGAYSDFVEKKDAFLDAQQQKQHALAGQVKREVEWLRRGAPARTTKAKGRIESAGKLINELAEVKYRNAQNRSADIDFSATNRKTKELLVAKELKKCMGARLLFDDVNVVLSPGVRGSDCSAPMEAAKQPCSKSFPIPCPRRRNRAEGRTACASYSSTRTANS